MIAAALTASQRFRARQKERSGKRPAGMKILRLWMRVCCVCGAVALATTSNCKSCKACAKKLVNQRKREWRSRNRGKYNEYLRKRRGSDIQGARRRDAARYGRNRNAILDRLKDWRAKKRAKILERERRYREKNRSELRAKWREHAAEKSALRRFQQAIRAVGALTSGA